jgi:hypothetical protein
MFDGVKYRCIAPHRSYHGAEPSILTWDGGSITMKKKVFKNNFQVNIHIILICFANKGEGKLNFKCQIDVLVYTSFENHLKGNDAQIIYTQNKN